MSAAAIEHYRVEWRSDLTTRWTLLSSHDDRPSAAGAVIQAIEQHGGQARVVAQSVVVVAGLGGGAFNGCGDGKVINVDDLRTALRQLPLYAIAVNGDDLRTVEDRNRVERPRLVDVLWLDDVWNVIEEAVDAAQG